MALIFLTKKPYVPPTSPGLWSWGNNTTGQLGLGDVVHRSSPVQVGSDTSWENISTYYYWSAAIKTDGTLWAMGYNTLGQLGQGDIIDYSSPVQVGSEIDWSTFICGGNHMLGIRSEV